MVALVATVIGMIQVVYIPEVMKQREAEHMDEVSNQFSYLKSMVDIQSTTGSNVPIFSMITLGSRELPYFASVPSFGSFTIIQEESSQIKIENASLSPPAYLTSITYSADNSYFVDQTYALEGGGIILDQPDGESVMRADPSISITNETLTVTVTYNLPVFIGVPEKDSTSGMGKCMIRTSYSGSDTQTYLSGIHSIQFYTNYVNAWNDSLSTILGGAGTVIKGTNYVQLNPYPGKTFGLVVKKLYISAQIGPGWVI